MLLKTGHATGTCSGSDLGNSDVIRTEFRGNSDRTLTCLSQTGEGFLLLFGVRLFKSQQRTLITDPVPTGLPATGEYKHAVGQISTPGEGENKIGTARWVEGVLRW